MTTIKQNQPLSFYNSKPSNHQWQNQPLQDTKIVPVTSLDELKAKWEMGDLKMGVLLNQKLWIRTKLEETKASQ